MNRFEGLGGQWGDMGVNRSVMGIQMLAWDLYAG